MNYINTISKYKQWYNHVIRDKVKQNIFTLGHEDIFFSLVRLFWNGRGCKVRPWPQRRSDSRTSPLALYPRPNQRIESDFLLGR